MGSGRYNYQQFKQDAFVDSVVYKVRQYEHNRKKRNTIILTALTCYFLFVFLIKPVFFSSDTPYSVDRQMTNDLINLSIDKPYLQSGFGFSEGKFQYIIELETQNHIIINKLIFIEILKV